MIITDGTCKFRVRKIGGVQAGIVQWFAGKTAPKGWLVCDGSAISRTDYDELFEVIGTTYGAGDGSTTFNLPNLIDRFAEGGKSVGTKKEAGLPNITGDLGNVYTFNDQMIDGGAIKKKVYDTNNQHTPYANSSHVGGKLYWNLNASLSNPIYGASDTVQPSSLILLPIIKY